MNYGENPENYTESLKRLEQLRQVAKISGVVGNGVVQLCMWLTSFKKVLYSYYLILFSECGKHPEGF